MEEEDEEDKEEDEEDREEEGGRGRGGGDLLLSVRRRPVMTLAICATNIALRDAQKGADCRMLLDIDLDEGSKDNGV